MNTDEKINPTVKDILLLLGIGTVLAASIIAPGLGAVINEYEKQRRKRTMKDWEKFNPWRLKQITKRLEQQKVVEIVNDEVKITHNGKIKLLRYKLETLQLKQKTDGYWRLIMYDIAVLKNKQRDAFRLILKRLKLLQIQKSVYLTPFVCDDEIEFLRQLFGLKSEVVLLKVAKLENESRILGTNATPKVF